MKQFRYTDKVPYIIKLIDIYAALFVKDYKLWLAEQEKEYLAMLILANSEGIDIDSTEAVRFLKSLGFEGNPYMYKKKLKNKKWIVVTEHGTILPPNFDYKGGRFKEEVAFNFKIVYRDEMGQDSGKDQETDE